MHGHPAQKMRGAHDMCWGNAGAIRPGERECQSSEGALGSRDWIRSMTDESVSVVTSPI